MADVAFVDASGVPLVDTAGAAVGRDGAHVARMVTALPVAGIEIVPAFATGRALALLGDSSATVAGRAGVYVSRMAWASRE